MKKMNVNKEQISMSELEQVNGGVGCKKKFLFQSLGQVLGYDDCYDSGTSVLTATHFPALSNFGN